MRKVRKVEMGESKHATNPSKLDLFVSWSVKPIILEVWGRIRGINDESERSISSGADLDRSRYAWISNEEPPALDHNSGKERSVFRQCWQTAVALIRSRSLAKNEAMRATISEGSWLNGA